MPRATAYVELLQAIQVDLEAVRNKKVGDMHVNVSDNMPPGIKADVIHGFHTNPTWNEGLVSWTYLGALMDAKNLSKKNERLATPA